MQLTASTDSVRGVLRRAQSFGMAASTGELAAASCTEVGRNKESFVSGAASAEEKGRLGSALRAPAPASSSRRAHDLSSAPTSPLLGLPLPQRVVTAAPRWWTAAWRRQRMPRRCSAR